jgi:AraC family transcriptional regulator
LGAVLQVSAGDFEKPQQVFETGVQRRLAAVLWKEPVVKRKAGRTAIASSAQIYENVLLGAGGTQLDAVLKDDARSSLCVAMYDCKPYDLQVPAMPVARLSVTLTASKVQGFVDGDRMRDYNMQPHSLFLAPAGATAHWIKQEASRHINIYFHADALGSEPDDGALWIKDQPLINASVPGVQPLAAALVHEMTVSDAFSAEAVDSLARLLLVRLMRFKPGAAVRKSPIDAACIARIRDYIQAHISEPILVADLAPLAGLSAYRFAHVFSQFTGRSPHQYVLCLRLARALNLLRSTPLGLAEVALASGFGSQQHLTHAMQRRLTTTPGRYRAKVR